MVNTLKYYLLELQAIKREQIEKIPEKGMISRPIINKKLRKETLQAEIKDLDDWIESECCVCCGECQSLNLDDFGGCLNCGWGT